MPGRGTQVQIDSLRQGAYLGVEGKLFTLTFFPLTEWILPGQVQPTFNLNLIWERTVEYFLNWLHFYRMEKVGVCGWHQGDLLYREHVEVKLLYKLSLVRVGLFLSVGFGLSEAVFEVIVERVMLHAFEGVCKSLSYLVFFDFDLAAIFLFD